MLRLPIALTTFLSLATAVAATPADVDRLHGIEPRSTGRKCGSHPTPDVVSKKEKVFSSLLANNEATSRVTAAAAFEIPVYFHVIYASRNTSGGYVP